MTAIRRTAIPSWLGGLVAATAVLIALGVVSAGFFASFVGLLIAGALALMNGNAAAAAVDSALAILNASIVAVLSAVYLLLLLALTAHFLPGSGPV